MFHFIPLNLKLKKKKKTFFHPEIIEKIIFSTSIFVLKVLKNKFFVSNQNTHILQVVSFVAELAIFLDYYGI